MNAIIIEEDITKIIAVGQQGPAGPPGEQGIPGVAGPPGTDAPPGDTILGKPTITPVLGSDLIPIVRGNAIFLALVSDVLAAQGITPEGSQLDFSNALNSGLAGVI